MADGQEEAVDGHVVALFVGLAHALHQMHAFHAVLAIEAHGIVLEQHLDLLVVHHALLHHLRRTQIGLAHDEVHLAGEAGQVGSLFAGRVATAHNGHHLLAVEEAVARGTGAHAHAGIFLLVLQAQVLGRGACGDDEGLGFEYLLVVDGYLVGLCAEVGRRSHAVADVGSEAFGLLAQVFHQLRASDAGRIAGEVLHFGGGGQLSARLEAGIDYRCQVGAPCIDGGCIAGRTRPDDEAFYFFCFHISFHLFCSTFKKIFFISSR